MTTSDANDRFANWLDQHGGAAVQVARAYTLNESDREELTQEILMQCWTSLSAFKGDSTLSTWFYRVALNTALKWKRHDATRRVRVGSPIEIEIVPDAQESVERRLQQDESIRQLNNAIRTLPQSDRALVLLHLDRLSYREIAEVLGISESNVGVRLHRIRRQLREMMGDESDD